MAFSHPRQGARQLATNIVEGGLAPQVDATSFGMYEAGWDSLASIVNESDFLCTADERSSLDDYRSWLSDMLIVEFHLDHLSAPVPKTSHISSTLAYLLRRLVTVLLPPPIFARDRSHIADEEKNIPLKLAYYQALSNSGLNCLAKLLDWEVVSDDDMANYYMCLASFTDASEPWTPESADKKAQRLIDRLHVSMNESALAELLGKLLRDTVKPNFVRSISPNITYEGRRAISQKPDARSFQRDEVTLRPWKYTNIFIPTVLRLILGQIQELTVVHGFIEENWSLLVPPILTLIDDTSVHCKRAGCSDLHSLLRSTPKAMLDRTGLAGVFEEAVMPCLMYLPTLNKKEDSLKLLSEAYATLIKLARVRFPDVQQHGQKMKCLHRIMRRGVYKTFALVSEDVHVIELLIRTTTKLVEELGSDAITQIKSITQMCAYNLMNPFATTYLALQKASVSLLEMLIICTWARDGVHVPEILQCLLAGWLGLQEERTSSNEVDMLKEQIINATRLLFLAGHRDLSMQNDLREIVQSDARAQDLLMAAKSEGHRVSQPAR